MSNTSTLIQQIKSSINERFAELKDNIGQSIGERIKNVSTDTYASKVAYTIKTVKDLSSSSTDPGVQNFSSIMMSARNETKSLPRKEIRS